MSPIHARSGAVVICALALALGSGLAPIQVVRAQAKPLLLSDVLASVRTHHPLLLAEAASLRAAEGESMAARGEFDPQLSLQGRAVATGYYDAKRFDTLLEQPTPLWGTSLYAGYRVGRGNIAPYYGEQRTLSRGEVRGGVRVPLLQDGPVDARRNGIRVAEVQREASAQGYDRTLLELSRDAASGYYAWLASGRRLLVAEELVALAEQRDAQVAEKVRLGALPRIESLDNRRTILERRRQLVVAQRALEKAAIDLSLFVRDAGGHPARLDRDHLPSELPLQEHMLPPLERAAERALAQRPELALVEAQLQVAELERALAQNRVLPRWDLFAEASKDFGRAPDQAASTLAPTVIEVGTTLSVPLGLRKARGKLRAASEKTLAARQKLQFARDKVYAEVLDAWSQLRAARERSQVAQEAATAAHEVAGGERERFELGATTLLFVNLREQAAADAQIAWLDAQVDVELAAVRARLTLGELELTNNGSRSQGPEAPADP